MMVKGDPKPTSHHRNGKGIVSTGNNLVKVF
jgi:hypothetical protein